jgi:RimJ/RimL family protein N-acetyltransferase
MHIETERLIIRPFQAEDLDENHEQIYGSAEVMRYLGDGKTRTKEEAERSMNRFVEYDKEHGFSIWAVIDQESQRFLGHCGLIHLRNEPETVELAYAFGKPYWGKGIATEAARACLRYGFESAKLDRIIGLTYPENKPSQHVLEKIGMQRQGETDKYYNLNLLLFTQTREIYQPDDSVYIVHSS